MRQKNTVSLLSEDLCFLKVRCTSPAEQLADVNMPKPSRPAQLNSNSCNQGQFHSSIYPLNQGSNPVSRDFRRGSAERPSGSSKVPGNPPLNASLDNLAPRLMEMERLQQLAILRERTRAAVSSTLSANDPVRPRTDRQQTKQPRPLDHSARCQAKINADFCSSRRGGQGRNSKSTKSLGMLIGNFLLSWLKALSSF
ncbi:uncharacterized protein PHA67_015977 [Liasis olivaceus]